MNSPENDPWLKDLQAAAGRQASLLDSVVEALQEAQRCVPEPSRDEIQAIRERRQPLSLPAYLRGYLQRVILAVEDAACDLRYGFEDEALAEALSVDPSETLVNAIEASLERPQR